MNTIVALKWMMMDLKQQLIEKSKLNNMHLKHFNKSGNFVISQINKLLNL